MIPLRFTGAGTVVLSVANAVESLGKSTETGHSEYWEYSVA